jgi:uncharacterized protein (DUF1778 family)
VNKKEHNMENSMSKTITLRLSNEEYDLYSSAAKTVKRSISNFINYLAQKKLEEDLFVDQIEMDEILGNYRLVTALQKGSKDAEHMKGAFADV